MQPVGWSCSNNPNSIRRKRGQGSKQQCYHKCGVAKGCFRVFLWQSWGRPLEERKHVLKLKFTPCCSLIFVRGDSPPWLHISGMQPLQGETRGCKGQLTFHGASVASSQYCLGNRLSGVVTALDWRNGPSSCYCRNVSSPAFSFLKRD